MATALQKIDLARPAVAATDAGAAQLSDTYWEEVGRLTGGLIRRRDTVRGPELRLAGVTLFRFAEAVTTVTPELVESRFAILGGLLAKEEAGALTFAPCSARPEWSGRRSSRGSAASTTSSRWPATRRARTASSRSQPT